MSDAEDTEAFIRFRASGDRKVRNQLVESYRWLAIACAHRFRDRGEPIEDLIQVGMLGLVKAVERFDPANGTPFPGYAVPTITGELRRHFRDTTWSLHVPRRMKELAALVSPASERLRERLKRHPTVAEVAEELRVSVDDVIGHLVNPVLHFPDEEQMDGGEGCLSIPGLTFDCLRRTNVVAHGQNEYGDPLTIDGTMMLSRAIQHEVDHLDGILFVDRLDPKTKKAALEAIRLAEWANVPPPVVKTSPHPLFGQSR